MDNSAIKVLSALQVIGHPRDSKRISMLQESGFQVQIVAFERDYHKGRVPSEEIIKLGRIENKNYVKRIWKIIKAIPILRREIKKNDIVYASGQDMAFMALIAGVGYHKPIILEVGDIVDLQLSKNLIGKVIRRLEKGVVNQYRLIVGISSGFFDGYYYGRLNVKTPSLVIENKLEQGSIPVYTPSIYTPLKEGPLRIGYFGLLRDEWSFNVLKKLAHDYPNEYVIYYAGMLVNPPDLDKQVEDALNMHYIGQYKSPSDLPHIYDKVDMVWACYTKILENDWNLKWGRPNRFFESCFFKKPVFAREGAHFATDVARFEIGKVIKGYDLSEVVNEIREITEADLKIWKQNLNDLPQDFYTYSSESQELGSRIRKILNK